MLSNLHLERLQYIPKKAIHDLSQVSLKKIHSDTKISDELKELFPNTYQTSPYEVVLNRADRKKLKIGVVFSGGPASGGHNVIWAMIDHGAEVIGFLNGPSGLINNKFKKLDDKSIREFKNVGGFDLIGSGRTKIETQEDLDASLKAVQFHNLDGLVIIGGDDSNTNAAILAEYFLNRKISTRVVGVPKTIDGDLRNEDIEISFGFDTACRLYSELIGNIAKDALSSRKYYHFIKLMGRSASNITLECALSTSPNHAIIAEEKKSLKQIVDDIVEMIIKRSEMGKFFGVILIPEGLIEFIPEMQQLLQNGHDLKNDPLFKSFPEKIQEQLLMEKDPHGNLQLSLIDTQGLLLHFVKNELNKRNFQGQFHPLEHFLGYEGRACFPTNFDANYCYNLGMLAYLAIRDGATGVICAISHLDKQPKDWDLKLVPIIQMMHLEKRKGKFKPVIKKALVDLSGKSMSKFSSYRKKLMIEDLYLLPGPIQYFGPESLTDQPPSIVIK